MAANKAFLKLAEIAASSKKNAAKIPEQDVTKAYWNGVVFQLAGKRYVSPIPEISEIIPVPRYTQVPCVQGWVRGVSNVRGRLLPIMDLSHFLFKLTSKQQARRKRVLIVDTGELYSGIVVDEVFGIQQFELDAYQEECEEQDNNMIHAYLNGQYVQNNGTWPVFSLFKLAVDPRFLKAAS